MPETGRNVDTEIAEAISSAKTLRQELDTLTTDLGEFGDSEFFSATAETSISGTATNWTITTRYDLEKTIPGRESGHVENMYWVNKPYVFVVILQKTDTNVHEYYVVEPYLTPVEKRIRTELCELVRERIDQIPVSIEDLDRERLDEIALQTLSDNGAWDAETSGPADDRTQTLRASIADRLDLFDRSNGSVEERADTATISEGAFSGETDLSPGQFARTLEDRTVEKLLYYVRRDILGYGRADPIFHDTNVDDISCNGPDSPVFCFHVDYEEIRTNVTYDKQALTAFIERVADRYGDGFDRHQYQKRLQLPDGSEIQITYGKYFRESRSSYTIRKFRGVGFTPVDHINWRIFSIDQMALLWLAIQYQKNLLVVGGPQAGPKTALNSFTTFIPSNDTVVSIDEGAFPASPNRNETELRKRPKHTAFDETKYHTEDLFEAAVRYRPKYIVLSALQETETQTFFQLISSGHTTMAAYHANSVEEAIRRLTSPPSNVAKSAVSNLDLITVQSLTRVKGRKVRRNRTISEIGEYDENDDTIETERIFAWDPATDEHADTARPPVLDEIQFEKAWNEQRLNEELAKRRVVLAYLISNSLNSYHDVVLTIQLFMNDTNSAFENTILRWIAEGTLQENLERIRADHDVEFAMSPEQESLVPRPVPGKDILNEAENILERNRELIERYEPIEKTTDLGELFGAGGGESGVADDADEGFDFGEFVPDSDEDS